MRWLSCVILIALGCLAAPVSAAADAIHPQDGPHADLKFDLRSDAFVADIAMNLVFLDYTMETGREQPDRIELSELLSLRERLRQRMAAVCAVRIDGRAVEPTIDGLAINDPDESLLPLFPRSGLRGLRKIKFQLRWAVSTPPHSVSIVWQDYPPDELSTLDPKPTLVLAAELTAEGVRQQLEFRASEPEYTWHSTPGGMRGRMLTVPEPARRAPRTVSLPAIGCAIVAVVAFLRAARSTRALRAVMLAVIATVATVVCATSLSALRVPLPGGDGANLPSEAEAAEIFRSLHTNLYRAFDFTTDAAVYDALALSVEGSLLEDTYLTIHRSLVVVEEGGAMSRVRDLRHVDVHVDSIGLFPSHDDPNVLAPGFVVTCRYQVDGRVTHWGHSHDRTNEYRARYRVMERDGGWRIVESEVLDQSRIDRNAPAPQRPQEKPQPDAAPDAAFDA